MNYRACFLIISALLLGSPAAHAAFPDDLASGVSLESTGAASGIQNFAVTANLQVSVTSSPVNSFGRGVVLNSDKASVWRNGSGVVSGVNANAWIFAKFGDNWYGATWEFIRKGQTIKSEGALIPGHFKGAPPWTSFSRTTGAYYGFMTSGLTRNGPSQVNVRERSNISWYQWNVGPVDESVVFGGTPAQPEVPETPETPETPILSPVIDLLLDEWDHDNWNQWVNNQRLAVIRYILGAWWWKSSGFFNANSFNFTTCLYN